MRILFASGNGHKAAEMRGLFPGHEIILPADAGITFEVDETGSTFMENAFLKADSLRARWEGPILADDSGICVDALGGAPGIRSARYGNGGGLNLETAQRNALLLKEMEGKRDRSCRFVCAMVLSLDSSRFLAAQETLEGILLEEPRGEGGFGYDPLVFVPERGLSVAELPEGEKNAISHRGKAAARIRAALKAI